MDAISVCSVICSPVPVSGAWKVCTYIYVCVFVFMVWSLQFRYIKFMNEASEHPRANKIWKYVYISTAHLPEEAERTCKWDWAKERTNRQPPVAAAENGMKPKSPYTGALLSSNIYQWFSPSARWEPTPRIKLAVEAVPSGGGEFGAGWIKENSNGMNELHRLSCTWSRTGRAQEADARNAIFYPLFFIQQQRQQQRMEDLSRSGYYWIYATTLAFC